MAVGRWQASSLRMFAGAVAVFAVMELAGCVGDGEPREPDESSPSATQVQAAQPSLSPSVAQVQAANGRDLSACRDADCEVEVRQGDVLRPTQSDLPLEVITVADLGQDRITLTMKSSTGQGMRLQGVQINVSSECVNGDCKDTGRLTITRDLPGRINDVRVRLVQVSDDRAVLALRAP